MSRLLPILGFLIVLIAANWPYRYEEVLRQPFGEGVQLLSAVATSSQHESPTMAGWPCKFYLSLPDAGEPSMVSFRWLALLLDLCFWALVPLAFWAYERFLFRRVKRSDALVIEEDEGVFDKSPADPKASLQPKGSKYDRKPKRRSVQLADIFVVTALIAGLFGYWQLLRKRGELDRKLASEISNSGGGAMRTAMLPWIARDLHRVGGLEVCLRISEVKLVNPDDKLLTKVVALPQLRTLNIAGGEFDLRILNRLATNPLLSELAIVGRPLNADAIAAIRDIPSLRKLNLMRTNITAAGVAALEQPRLQELNLVHTDVRLEELGTPMFSKSIRKLTLPHPAKGSGDSLTLDGWPELRELACYEYEERLNREPIVLTLKNLPKLYKVELDGLQKFDIDFEQLPTLAKLEPTYLQSDQRMTPNEIVPDALWAGKLRLKDVPSLNALTIFAADTEAISIAHGTLQVGLSVYSKGGARLPPAIRNISSKRTDYLSEEDIPVSRRQKWIDDLANCSGLEKINLELVPLDGVSLKPLVANKSLRELVLDHCGLAIPQLKELQGMEQLHGLSLIGANVDGQTIEWLVKTLPSLRRLRCDRATIQRLRLENVQNLETIFEPLGANDPYRYLNLSYPGQTQIDALKLVNTPAYRDYFVLKGPMKLLHIESAPALSGLSFHAALPKNAVLKGVENLKFFAAGGPTCTEEIVSGVLACKGLQRLTLAYTQLSPETWQKIAGLRELEYLDLTGSNVTEECVEALAGLEKLKALRLGHTSLNKAALAKITTLRNLEIFDFDGLQLTSEDVSLLVSKLPKLKRVSFAGAVLTADNMRQISKLYSIQVLDLSGCELSNELLSAFVESPPSQLIELKLNSATLGDEGFLKVMRSLPVTQFALRNSTLKLALLDELMAKNRVTEFDDTNPSDAIVRKLRRISASNAQNVEPPHFSDIDPAMFAPREKDPLEK